MKASFKNHPLNVIMEDLKIIVNEEIQFKNNYEGSFKKEELTNVLGALVLNYSDWVERIEAIEERLNSFICASNNEKVTKVRISDFIKEKKERLIQNRNYASAHPRTFREGENKDEMAENISSETTQG